MCITEAFWSADVSDVPQCLQTNNLEQMNGSVLVKLVKLVKPSDCPQTMFELISGFGVWNRRYFVLKECTMSYWNHPNDEGTKVRKDHMTLVHEAAWLEQICFVSQEAEDSVSLSGCCRSVRAVQRELCARPFTFELLRAPRPQQDAGDQALAR